MQAELPAKFLMTDIRCCENDLFQLAFRVGQISILVQQGKSADHDFGTHAIGYQPKTLRFHLIQNHPDGFGQFCPGITRYYLRELLKRLGMHKTREETA